MNRNNLYNLSEILTQYNILVPPNNEVLYNEENLTSQSLSFLQLPPSFFQSPLLPSPTNSQSKCYAFTIEAPGYFYLKKKKFDRGIEIEIENGRNNKTQSYFVNRYRLLGLHKWVIWSTLYNHQ